MKATDLIQRCEYANNPFRERKVPSRRGSYEEEVFESMKADFYEVKVELIAINVGTGEKVVSYGSMPIKNDLQNHIEMAGRAAAVQAYLFILRQGVEP